MIVTVDFKEISQTRCFCSVLEESFDITCALETVPTDLWKWAKKNLHRVKKQRMYGNLYKKAIAAANCCGDAIASKLEKEYIAWKIEMGIKGYI